MQGGAFRRKELSRAYQRGYGKEISAFKKEEKELWHWFKYHRKQAVKNRREFRGYRNSYDDLFSEFFYDTDDLIWILDEIVTWPESKLKTKMSKLSRDRLTILRDLIDKWLNQQQSSRT